MFFHGLHLFISKRKKNRKKVSKKKTEKSPKKGKEGL